MTASVVHGIKIIVYITLGFAFMDYWRLLIFMMVMAILGSWVGTMLRYRISIDWLKKILPYMLTILALHLIGEKLLQVFA